VLAWFYERSLFGIPVPHLFAFGTIDTDRPLTYQVVVFLEGISIGELLAYGESEKMALLHPRDLSDRLPAVQAGACIVHVVTGIVYPVLPVVLAAWLLPGLEGGTRKAGQHNPTL
jgi:hypothetical protein